MDLKIALRESFWCLLTAVEDSDRLVCTCMTVCGCLLGCVCGCVCRVCWVCGCGCVYLGVCLLVCVEWLFVSV